MKLHPGKLVALGLKLVARGFNGVAIVTLALMILLVGSDVAARLVGIGGVPGSIQYTQLLLVVLAFTSLAEGQRHGDHVAIDVVYSRLPMRAKRISNTVTLALSAAFFMWAAWASGNIALDSIQRGEVIIGVTAVPVWPARLAVSAGFFALAFVLSSQAIDALIDRDNDSHDLQMSVE